MTDININEVYEELKYLGELPETSRLIKGYLALREENEKLRALVKEMTDKLHRDYCCEDVSYFDGCDITDICYNAGTCALVARAREMIGGDCAERSER